MTAAPTAPATDTRNRSLYRTIWRWHFFAGLFAIPVLAILCLSGLVWLFKPQIWGLMYGDIQHVTPAAQTVTYQQQVDAALAAHPGASVLALHTPATADRSTIVDLSTAGGGELSVYVDPYTGRTLGEIDSATDPSMIALDLHGTLMTGRWLGNPDIGDRFIEIVAGWTIVLLVTGVYLWWPRGRGGWRAALRIRRGLRGRRPTWRDVHAVTGVLFSFVTLFFLLTGLAWTGWWGPHYLSTATSAMGGYPEVATESRTVGELLPNGRSPWALGNLPLAASQPAPSAGSQLATGELRWDPAQGAPVDAVLARAQTLGFPHGFAAYYPEGETGSYMIAYWADGPQEPNRHTSDTRMAYIDQYTAQVLGTYGFDEYGWAAKATDFGIVVHEGREWGLVNQLLVAVAVLAILVSLASSVVMWRKRRPTGLGAPRREPRRTLGFGLLLVIALLGILFPLLGASILAVLVLDTLVVQRVPALARAFGSAPRRSG